MQNLVSGDGGIENFSLADFGAFNNKTSLQFNSYANLINNVASAAQSVSTTTEAMDSIAAYKDNNDSWRFI
jgi:hypothetical protein